MTLKTREMEENLMKEDCHTFRIGTKCLTVLFAHRFQCARTSASRLGKNTKVLYDQTCALRSDALGQS